MNTIDNNSNTASLQTSLLQQLNKSEAAKEHEIEKKSASEAEKVEIDTAYTVEISTQAQKLSASSEAASTKEASTEAAPPPPKPAAQPVEMASTSESSNTVYDYELYAMTESELLDLVQDGSITRMDMNNEIARRSDDS